MDFDSLDSPGAGSACGSNDEDEVRDDVDEAGEADKRVRRFGEGIGLSVVMVMLYVVCTRTIDS